MALRGGGLRRPPACRPRGDVGDRLALDRRETPSVARLERRRRVCGPCRRRLDADSPPSPGRSTRRTAASATKRERSTRGRRPSLPHRERGQALADLDRRPSIASCWIVGQSCSIAQRRRIGRPRPAKSVENASSRSAGVDPLVEDEHQVLEFSGQWRSPVSAREGGPVDHPEGVRSLARASAPGRWIGTDLSSIPARGKSGSSDESSARSRSTPRCSAHDAFGLRSSASRKSMTVLSSSSSARRCNDRVSLSFDLIGVCRSR